MQKLLIIEDHKDFQITLSRTLGTLGLQISIASNAEEALAYLNKDTFDLVIMDLGLPDRSGFDLFSALQNIPHAKDTPVIFVTGSSGIAEKVTAFSLGAEDYIIKPFNAMELKARVENRLKKSLSKKKTMEMLTVDALSINLVSHTVSVRDDSGEKTVDLTQLEYKLLIHLVKHQDNVFSRDQLIDSVWGNGISVSDRTVDFHIHGLRKKLGPVGKHIEAVSGVGYQFLSTVAKKNKAA